MTRLTSSMIGRGGRIILMESVNISAESWIQKTKCILQDELVLRWKWHISWKGRHEDFTVSVVVRRGLNAKYNDSLWRLYRFRWERMIGTMHADSTKGVDYPHRDSAGVRGRFARLANFRKWLLHSEWTGTGRLHQTIQATQYVGHQKWRYFNINRNDGQTGTQSVVYTVSFFWFHDECRR